MSLAKLLCGVILLWDSHTNNRGFQERRNSLMANKRHEKCLQLVIQRWWPSAAGDWILCMQIEHIIIKWSANMLWNAFVTYYGCHGFRFSPLLSLSTFSLSQSCYALAPLLLSVSSRLVDVYVLNVSITQPWGTCTKNWLEETRDYACPTYRENGNEMEQH